MDVTACTVAGRRGRSASDDAEAHRPPPAVRPCASPSSVPHGGGPSPEDVWRFARGLADVYREEHGKDVDAASSWETASGAYEDEYVAGHVDEYAEDEYAEDDYKFSAALMSRRGRPRRMR